MSGAGLTETEIGADLFPKAPVDSYMGRYLACYAGHAVAGTFRESGSSGGLISWTLDQLLRSGRVDAVIHVLPTSSDAHPYFAFGASRSPEEVHRGAKSRYYPVELSGALRLLKENQGRYAVVGLPCFIKGVRLLAQQDEDIRQRVRFCISLVCGHLKTTAFTDQLAMQSGVDPRAIRSIDFRHKLQGRPAYEYAVRIEHQNSHGDPVNTIKPTAEMFGRDWGLGLFQYEACDFCDDVLGECADASFGDAWLPGYANDAAGTNVVVVRHTDLHELFTTAIREGEVKLDSLTPEQVAQSQAGGLRHRRDGLAYRLHLKDSAGEWRPRKRVAAQADHLTKRRKLVFRLRQEISRSSHTAFAQTRLVEGIAGFVRRMAPLISRYEQALKEPLLARLQSKASRTFRHIVRRSRPTPNARQPDTGTFLHSRRQSGPTVVQLTSQEPTEVTPSKRQSYNFFRSFKI